MGTKKKRGSVISRVLLLVFIGTFCFAGYKVYDQLSTEHSENQAFEDLLREVQSGREARQSNAPQALPTAEPAQDTPAPVEEERAPAAPTEKALPAADAAETPLPASLAEVASPESAVEETSLPAGLAEDAPPETIAVATNTPAPTEVPPILSEYAALYAKNHRLFGWIEIPGTNVNYPVMHVPDNPEYYLHRAFDGSYSYSGVPFLAGECYIGCGNYIVYGHHMKNGTMFAGMLSYGEEKFWQEYPTIRFDTLYASETYEVIAAFYGKVYPDSTPDVFRYYFYTDLTDPETFAEYVAQVKAAALYDTGVDAAYGDQLLTLSTCSYHTDDGRFVVVAKRISSTSEASPAAE